MGTTAPGELLQLGSVNREADSKLVFASGQSAGPNSRAWEIGTIYGGASVADPN